MTAPSATASAQVSRPVASRSQVAASVSTTLGGVPRVCRGPGHQLDGDVRRHPQLHRPAGHLLGQPAGAGLHRRADARPAAAARPRRPARRAPASTAARSSSAGIGAVPGHQLVGTVARGNACRTASASGVPNRAGSVAVQAARSSASGSSSRPSTSSASPPVVPSSVTGTPAARGRSPARAPGRTS